MKVLVTGGYGMMGSSLKIANEMSKQPLDLIFTGKHELDVRNINDIRCYRNMEIGFIIHLAAETDHKRAEQNWPNTYLINQTGTQNVVELARELRVPIIYIGTCGMFDGTKSEYFEDDEASPLNHYGRSKYYGEQSVRSYPEHYILRSGWGMGGGPNIDHKFIGQIYKRRGDLRMFAITDVFGSPTYDVHFAKTMIHIVNKIPHYGTYNVADYGKASRFAVARHFFKCIGAKTEVVPVSFSEYHSMMPIAVQYTKCEVLNTDKILRTGISEMHDWQTAVEEYAERSFK